jgi:hypothetical protein
MSNAANLFDVSKLFWTGTKGDISCSGGVPVISEFPFSASGVVYVDNNWQVLSGRGLLAYPNLYEAVASWRTSGAARTRYGTPNAYNHGIIMLGAGKVQMLPEGLPINTHVSVDVEHIAIVGQGIDVTSLSTYGGSWSAGANSLDVAAANFSIQNLTINQDHNCDPNDVNLGGISFSVPTSGIIDRVKFYGRGNSYSAQSFYGGSNFNGVVRNCIFDAKGASVDIMVFQGGFNGVVENCVFNVIPGTNCAINLVNASAGDKGSISNCTFSGSPASKYFVFIADNDYLGEINNCYFTSRDSGTVGIAAYETAAGNPSRPLITDCTFEMCGPCISGQLGIATRIVNCYCRTELGNQSCIYLAPGYFGNPGEVTVIGSTLIANGTGLCVYVNHTGESDCLIANNILRLPQGGSPGDSISNNIVNVALNPFNTEIPSSITI